MTHKEQGVKTFSFQTEITQLISIIKNTEHSFNKEFFLRELMSNSSNALDKILCTSLIDPKKIAPIGMTKSDLIKNLGKITKHRAKRFMEAYKAKDYINMELFGVGFHTIFWVANKVKTTSNHDDDEQYTWESFAGDSFKVRQDNSEPLLCGTKIV